MRMYEETRHTGQLYLCYVYLRMSRTYVLYSMYHVAWWWCTYAHQYVHDGGLVCVCGFIVQSASHSYSYVPTVAIATLRRVLMLMKITKGSNFEGV